MSVKKYVVLPQEVTDFEHNYLVRLNRIALYFFYVHIPVFMLVAWASDTGPLFALILTVAMLIGPTIAQFSMKNERAKSIVYGITAMCMGGLLVHFGQGPVQIEMHFYFFALLAMLCAYANPTVNIVAAITLALHHLIFWYLLPSSVFNYDAPVWVVAVHALFVVLETFATCYISRRFFDDVIGLEKIVQARTKEVHLILNNIGQGFLTVGLDGVMSNERSSIISKWFGECGAHTSFASYIKSFDDQAAEWFELGMESICEGFLPIEVTLEQLPKRIILGSSTLDLSYKPILDQNGTIENILIIISDITSEIEREASKQQQQLMDIFGHIMRDKLGFLEFLTDTDQMMDVVKKNKYEDIPHLKRIIHTIKGNAGLFGMTDIANLCHELEDEIVTKKDAPTLPKLKTLDQAWVHIRLQLDQLLGERMNKAIEINDADYEAVLRALLNREAPEKIARMMRSWKLETAQHRLEFIKKQAEGLALRMGKKGIQVITQANNIRFESEYWAPFWSNFIHVLRNAIDHGIENQDERSETNKTGKGSIYIETAVEKDQLLISVKDDGRGVNWRAIKEKAEKADLPHMNQDDLLEAIYKDGISTKNVVTHFSGRGVGMGAVRDICADLGGRMELKSEVGKGTRILFQFPLSDRVYNSVDDMPERAA